MVGLGGISIPVGNPGYDSSLSRTGKWFRSKWQSWKPETRPGTGRLEVWEPLASLFRRLGIIDIPSIRETLELAFWGNEGFRSGAERNGENRNFLSEAYGDGRESGQYIFYETGQIRSQPELASKNQAVTCAEHVRCKNLGVCVLGL